MLLSSKLLRDNAETFWNGEAWKLIVTDATGLIMFTLHFVAVNAPATQHYAARHKAGAGLERLEALL